MRRRVPISEILLILSLVTGNWGAFRNIDKLGMPAVAAPTDSAAGTDSKPESNQCLCPQTSLRQ